MKKQMQKSMKKLNANIVGANCIRPHFGEITPKNKKGITLIALIITIIVMLILVGVTVNIALSGGLFSKAEEAGSKTKIAEIQETLMLKKAELIADDNGKIPTEYDITFGDLNLPAELETEFSNKLIIGKDGKLYYDATVVTNTAEQNRFEEMGIQKYEENGGVAPIKSGYYTHKRSQGESETQVWYIEVKEENIISIMYYNIKEGAIAQNIDFGEFTISEENTDIVNLINYSDDTTITVEPDYYVFEAEGNLQYIKGNKFYPWDHADKYIEATLDENFVLPQ